MTILIAGATGDVVRHLSTPGPLLSALEEQAE